YRSFDTYAETGAIGLPEEASAEKGERSRSIIAEELASLLDAVHEQNA
ncbi:creatininase family protein, partial [Halobellus sp. Atlit-38R]